MSGTGVNEKSISLPIGILFIVLWEQITCFLSFTGSEVEGNCGPEWIVPIALPIPDLISKLLCSVPASQQVLSNLTCYWYGSCCEITLDCTRVLVQL